MNSPTRRNRDENPAARDSEGGSNTPTQENIGKKNYDDKESMIPDLTKKCCRQCGIQETVLTSAATQSQQ